VPPRGRLQSRKSRLDVGHQIDARSYGTREGGVNKE